ncbi:AsnC family transcriptional regulator [Amylibacter marinus]|uniref:AsnC family transcriptional regulator n=1 Tax=Amylibacter marinus TaxID=1475483 RepID=A0ABQ5VU46_9RHOB|nr:Lrp/AsnC family transcriptional regulator [Amylibacter marinus]GLQ34743.1 AsnC family transcriptional regulator [Amylibacter marinus]
MVLDGYDVAILTALQGDGAMTNATLGGQVGLSASQSSRRRAALEAAGLILGYGARVDAGKLGFGFRAMTRVNLRSHSQERDSDFSRFIESCSEVRAAFSVSGDADYVLDIRVRDLESFARFIHEQLLPHPQVSQVQSEIVLKTLKEKAGVDLTR